MDAGKLVPDEVIIGIVARSAWLSPTAQDGFILDGVPRTIGPGRGPGSGRRHALIDVLSIEISDEEIERAHGADAESAAACGAPYHMHAKPPKQEGNMRQLRRRTDAARG